MAMPKGDASSTTTLEKYTVLKQTPVRKSAKPKSDQNGTLKKGQVVIVEVRLAATSTAPSSSVSLLTGADFALRSCNTCPVRSAESTSWLPHRQGLTPTASRDCMSGHRYRTKRR